MKPTKQQRRVEDKYESDLGFRISNFEFDGLKSQSCSAAGFSPRGAFFQIRNPKSEIRNSSRAGATLTEVLIALLIMSIGLVSLAVLFPISVLRSIKASQFTTATDSRYNAEAMIDLFPNMIRNPDYTTAANHANENFVVDPLGYAVTAGPLNSAAVQALAPYFGNDPSLPVAPNPGFWPFRRYPLTWTTESTADYLVTMPDSWIVEFEGPGTNLSNPPTSATGPTQVDVTGLSATLSAIPAGTSVRALIFTADGLSSQARSLTSIGGAGPATGVDTIKWTEDLNANNKLDPGEDINGNGNLDHYPLPAAYTAATIGKVRIEVQDRRYTWLLTVRNSGGVASVDVVVFFKRKFEINKDELLYQATFNSGNNQVTIAYTAGSPPFMHKGNYIFDANNAFWYRISNVNDNGQGQATILLDVPANATSPQPVNNKVMGRAMFPRNIVDVYPIGAK